MKNKNWIVFFFSIIYFFTGIFLHCEQIYHLKTPDYRVEITKDGFHSIRINGYFSYGLPGFPDLPSKIYRIAVPPDVDLNTIVVEYNVHEKNSIGVFHIRELPPMATWVDGQKIIGKKANTYTQDAYYPEKIIEFLGVSQMRKWKIVTVKFTPFQYNPVTQDLRHIPEVFLTIQYNRKLDKDISDMGRADKVMDERAKSILMNYHDAEIWYAPKNKVPAPSQPYDYAIITTNYINTNSTKLTDFMNYLISKGHSPIIVTEDEYGILTGQAPNGTAEKIREWLKNNYISYSIEYVLLIGNPSPTGGDVPMKMCWPRNSESSDKESPTDYFYADLTGNWDLDGDGYFGEYPDDDGIGGVDFANEVYVGRIPVYSGVSYLDSVLTKTISYGNATSISWRESAMLPMSYSDSSTDGAYLGEAMKSDYLSPAAYSSWTLYMQGSLCSAADSSFSSNEELIDGATKSRWISNSYGMVWWWGHGSSTSASLGYSGCGWGTILNTGDTSSLNDNYPAFVYQCSCTNGYPEASNNLGTALLYNGAIGTVSATRVSWYAVTSWATGLKYYCDNASIGYYYGEELVSNDKSAAKALYDVKSDMGANHYTFWDGCHWMNLFDFNLYGEPTMSLSEHLEVHTVSTPDTPVGPSEGAINILYTYTTGGSTCSQGHGVEYRFDWGDATYSDWSISTSASHAWSTADTYTVKAQARCSVNPAILSGWSSGKTVTIYTCLPPSAPTNPSPSNGATNISDNADLDWNDCTGADSYDVYFGGTSPPSYYGNTTESSYTLPQLNNSTKYHWQIVAKNACGNTPGNEWNFTTKASTNAAQRLTNTSASSTKAVQARWGANVYIAWKEGNFLYFRRNTNYGEVGHWVSPVQLIASGELDSWGNPLDIAAYGSYVYLVMARRPSPTEDYEIYFRRSTDYGNSWESWKRLTNNLGESRRPSIACEASAVYVAWQDNNPGNYEIYFKKGSNNGASFSSAKRLSYSTGSSQYPCLAARGGNVQLVWQDDNPGNYEIYHKRNTNWGANATWSSLKRITYNSGYSWYPRIVCDSTGQYIQLVWSDNNPGNYEIYHKRNTDYGGKTSWSAPIRICYNSGTSYYPDVDLSGSTVDIVWCDNNPGNWEIFGKQSTNYGSAFGGVKRWTYNSGKSERPKINCYNYALLWDDTNPGNKEIFYK